MLVAYPLLLLENYLNFSNSSAHPVINCLKLYDIKKFFKTASSYKSKQRFCADYDVQLEDSQKYCIKISCQKKEPNILLELDAVKGIQRIFASK